MTILLEPTRLEMFKSISMDIRKHGNQMDCLTLKLMILRTLANSSVDITIHQPRDSSTQLKSNMPRLKLQTKLLANSLTDPLFHILYQKTSITIGLVKSMLMLHLRKIRRLRRRPHLSNSRTATFSSLIQTLIWTLSFSSMLLLVLLPRQLLISNNKAIHLIQLLPILRRS